MVHPWHPTHVTQPTPRGRPAVNNPAQPGDWHAQKPSIISIANSREEGILRAQLACDINWYPSFIVRGVLCSWSFVGPMFLTDRSSYQLLT